jgi:hypothetical protein
MNQKAHGQVRRSQVITTWGPGALLDLPRYTYCMSRRNFRGGIQLRV